MTKLPYLTSPGNLSKAFEGIKNAAVPPKVTQDFVKTVLKIPGGSGDNLTTFLRRMGFVNSDGTPSEIYAKFRNSATTEIAAAQAMNIGYAEIFRRNQYAHKLSREELKGLIVEVTGSSPEAKSVTLAVSTFSNFNEFANFEAVEPSSEDINVAKVENIGSGDRAHQGLHKPEMQEAAASMGMNLGYTININLPSTTDIEVFNAIFKSIKENLLKNDD